MYYVSMTDEFMSGWGHANGKTNKLVLGCNNWKEALLVKRNAQDRPEMKHINICGNKPYYDKRYYYTTYHGKPDYKQWYQEDRPFKRRD